MGESYEYSCVSLEKDAIPLVVDLDGSLVQTDLLYESFFGTVAIGLRGILETIGSLRKGKAALKRSLANSCEIDYSTLPYNKDILALVREARHAGRPTCLATAADHKHAHGIASHLELFDSVLASDGKSNLSASQKAEALSSKFGEGNFDYVGNSADDLHVWRKARHAYIVGQSAGLSRKLSPRRGKTHIVGSKVRRFPSWIKALRVHQYSKNLLIFVPLFAAQLWTLSAFVNATLAFVSFSLCASAIYIFNDLLDLKSDRSHPSKKSRPLASGAVPIAQAPVVAFCLLMAGMAIGAFLGWQFIVVLAGYIFLTTAYSLYLKRRMLVDVVALALLYTTRIFAGAAAVDVTISQWLLGFSMFVFVSLALTRPIHEATASCCSDGDVAVPD
ncbi:UbiA family prenyltransferase [Croceicoccus hydrothermalis]|uniref:UbiA family prenyltransferase n=1 Tax=Croceicoccus hydrothermalis TaxID=2867964 RepID=UPI001EFA4814|nr:UbiA family prenyltransferase [Croceicoccus hydrothermalis]